VICIYLPPRLRIRLADGADGRIVEGFAVTGRVEKFGIL